MLLQSTIGYTIRVYVIDESSMTKEALFKFTGAYLFFFHLIITKYLYQLPVLHSSAHDDDNHDGKWDNNYDVEGERNDKESMHQSNYIIQLPLCIHPP